MRPLLLLAGLLLFVAASLHSAEITKGPLAEGKNVPGAFHPYNVTAREIHPDELEESEKEDKDKEKKKYTSKGKFHCLVTEYDLDPVILLVAKGLNDSEGFQNLLKKLDAAMEWRNRKEAKDDKKDEKKDEIPPWLEELRKKKKIDGGTLKNRLRRLRAFVVILDDSLPNKGDVVKEDDKRDRLEKDIQKIADDLSLKHVVLTLAAKGDLKKYEIDDSKALTAVLYRTLTIRSSHTFLTNELEKKDARALEPLLDAVIEKLLPK